MEKLHGLQHATALGAVVAPAEEASGAVVAEDKDEVALALGMEPPAWRSRWPQRGVLGGRAGLQGGGLFLCKPGGESGWTPGGSRGGWRTRGDRVPELGLEGGGQEL